MYFIQLYFLVVISLKWRQKSKFFKNLFINIDFLAYSLGKNFLFHQNEQCNKYFTAVLENFYQNFIENPKNGDFWLKSPVILQENKVNLVLFSYCAMFMGHHVYNCIMCVCLPHSLAKRKTSETWNLVH